jgi:hypothetical protein
MARKHDVSGLNAALRRCAAELYSAIRLELGYPDQSDIRERIETIERGALAVRQALDGSNLILDPILRGRRGDLPHERKGFAMLRELGKRISLFKKQKPPRRGRPKPRTNTTPILRCAKANIGTSNPPYSSSAKRAAHRSL